MTPFDMHYEQDLLFSADLEIARLLSKPRAQAPKAPVTAARPAVIPSAFAPIGEQAPNPAALRHAIAAERGPASFMERTVQALDSHCLVTTISVLAAYLALIHAA